MDTTHRTPRTLRAAPLAAALALALGALQAPAPEAAERGAVSAGPPPASEAKSKKTGKRKPRESVRPLEGSPASAGPTALPGLVVTEPENDPITSALVEWAEKVKNEPALRAPLSEVGRKPRSDRHSHGWSRPTVAGRDPARLVPLVRKLRQIHGEILRAGRRMTPEQARAYERRLKALVARIDRGSGSCAGSPQPGSQKSCFCKCDSAYPKGGGPYSDLYWMTCALGCLTMKPDWAGSGTPPSIAPLDIKKLNLKPPKNRPPRLPYFTQLGPTPVAKVPMKRVSCGPNCTEWKLASSHGNLKIEGWIDMYCPAGTMLTYLAYRPQGGQETVVKQGQTKIQGYSKRVWPKPFTAAQLEKACQKALKGYPASNAPVAKKLITTTVYARGRCSDSATVHEQGYPVTLRLQCVPPPTPG